MVKYAETRYFKPDAMKYNIKFFTRKNDRSRLNLVKRGLVLVLFVRLFGLCLFRFVGFLFLLVSGKGCGL